MHIITLQLFVLVAAAFLFVYTVKNGLGKIYRIFTGLIVLGAIALLIASHFSCCHYGGGCSSQQSCASGMMHGGSEGCSHSGMKSCGMGDHSGCMQGPGHSCKMGHGNKMGCPHMQSDSMIEIEKEVIIKNGDTTVTEIRR